MVVYLEACYSGSMFKNLSADLNGNLLKIEIILEYSDLIITIKHIKVEM